MGCWLRITKLYLPLWVDSRPRKGKNPFCTLKVGLTAGLQSRSWGSTIGCSVEIGYHTPCRTRIQTGSRVWDWYWHNEFLAQMFCKPEKPNPFKSTPTTSLAQRASRVQHSPPPTTDGGWTGRGGAHGYIPRQGLWNKTKTFGEEHGDFGV